MGAEIIPVVDYTELSCNRKVINRSNMPPIVHINLPDYVVNNHYILNTISEVDSDESLSFDCCFPTPWIDIMSSNLNCSSGMHTYRLTFLDSQNSDVLYMYFSYIIQDDNPDTPYIYMKRSEDNG